MGGTLTGVLDQIDDRGLIRRQQDGKDRRICQIWLMGMGRELQTVLPPIIFEKMSLK